MIGMSNWTKEGCGSQLFGNPPVSIQPPPVNDKNCGLGALPDDRKYSFIYKATSHSQVNNGRLIFADCAEIGAVAGYWINDSQGPQGGPAHLWTNCHDIITALGLTDAQVQVVLFKQADSGESSPPPPNPTLMPLPTGAGTFAGCSGSPQEGQPYACNLQACMTTIAQQVKVHYPNVQQMFLHSRIYAGYADPVESPLNPEPYAYEQGFAIKWLIKAQMDEVDFPGAYPHAPVLDYRTNIVPWLDWGTYMWASGTTVPCVNCPMYPVPTPPPAQPLKWVDTNPNHGDNNHCPINHVQTQECDFQAKTGTKIDNLHPSFCGRDKVSNLMMYFYCNSPYTTPWFTTSGQKCTWTPPDNSCTYGQGADTL